MATPVTTMLGKPFPVANFDDVVMGPTNASFLGCPALPRKREYPHLGPSAARIVAGRLAQYRPKANATLCPPKPNELLMAYWYSP